MASFKSVPNASVMPLACKGAVELVPNDFMEVTVGDQAQEAEAVLYGCSDIAGT